MLWKARVVSNIDDWSADLPNISAKTHQIALQKAGEYVKVNMPKLQLRYCEITVERVKR